VIALEKEGEAEGEEAGLLDSSEEVEGVGEERSEALGCGEVLLETQADASAEAVGEVLPEDVPIGSAI
jgi:hypothetical protein